MWSCLDKHHWLNHPEYCMCVQQSTTAHARQCFHYATKTHPGSGRLEAEGQDWCLHTFGLYTDVFPHMNTSTIDCARRVTTTPHVPAHYHHGRWLQVLQYGQQLNTGIVLPYCLKAIFQLCVSAQVSNTSQGALIFSSFYKCAIMGLLLCPHKYTLCC